MVNDYFIPIYCILPKRCVVKEVFVSQRWISHAAIVTPEEFEQAQMVIMLQHGKHQAGNYTKHQYPLKGKVYCGYCQKLMKYRVLKKLGPSFNCRFSATAVDSPCKRIPISEELLEEIVRNALTVQIKQAEHICVLQRKDRKSIAITPCAAEHPMSFKVPGRLLTDGQCRMMINGIQFIQVLLEANGLAAGKDHQFKGRYDAEKNAVIISLEKDEQSALSPQKCTT